MKEIKKGFGIDDTQAFNAYHVLHGGQRSVFTSTLYDILQQNHTAGLHICTQHPKNQDHNVFITCTSIESIVMIHQVMNFRKYPSLCTSLPTSGSTLFHQAQNNSRALTSASETENQLVSFFHSTLAAPIIQYSELHQRKDTPVVPYQKKKQMI